jgi:outer membrane protein assembly factor BamB
MVRSIFTQTSSILRDPASVGSCVDRRWRFQRTIAVCVLTVAAAVPRMNSAADWPQYMRDAAHTADARDEHLATPLRLDACIALDDAVLTSPAVVDGTVYVVDQMGAAYCIDPGSASIVWKTTAPGVDSVGGNTSSPSVLDGVVAFGTTAGQLVLLDATTGDVRQTVDFDQPILGAITAEGGRYYLQTIDGVIHCVDQQGSPCWQYDPYADSPRDPGSRAKRQYCGVPVAVLGHTVVAAVGFDLVGLRDHGHSAEQIWKQPAPISDTYLPAGISLADGWVYASFPGKDGLGALVRLDLATGEFDRERDVLDDQWAILNPPAVRDGRAYFCRQAFGLSAARFGERPSVAWSTFSSQPDSVTPAIAAPALVGEYCLFSLLSGGLAIARTGVGETENSRQRIVQTIALSSRSAVTSSPAVSNGAVYFGCDDGCLYVVRSGEAKDEPERTRPGHVTARRGEATAAGDRRYGWPSAFGGPTNANFIDDPTVRPPFRLRWATKSEGLFKQAVCATQEDLVYVTLGGLVVCREQLSGRIRWRRHLPGQAWCRSALLAADGRVYVPRMFSLRYPKSLGARSTLYCLGLETGEIEWEASIGIGDRLRASPVYCNGVVAYGSLYREGEPPTFFAADRAMGQAIEGWNAATGELLWRVKLESSGTLLNGPAGCAGDGLLYFTGGGEGPRDRGETIAIDPQTGDVRWRSPRFASQTGTPSFRDGRLYLPGTYHRPVACLAADTGETVWTNDLAVQRWHVDTVSLGPDYFSVNNKYEGGAWRWDARTGKPVELRGEPLQLWGPAHGCGAIVLTASGHALSATIGGLCMTDVDTGKLVWNTPGFGSYTCPHPIAANGRIFYAPQTSGLLFCFEPAGDAE